MKHVQIGCRSYDWAYCKHGVSDNLIEVTPDVHVIAQAIENLCAEKNAAANVGGPCAVAASAHAVLA